MIEADHSAAESRGSARSQSATARAWRDNNQRESRSPFFLELGRHRSDSTDLQTRFPARVNQLEFRSNLCNRHTLLKGSGGVAVGIDEFLADADCLEVHPEIVGTGALALPLCVLPSISFSTACTFKAS